MAQTKEMGLLTGAFAALLFLCSGCGQTYTLPPLGESTQQQPVPAGNTGNPGTTDGNEPALPAQYAMLLGGRPVAIYQATQRRACLTSLSPCQGVFRDDSGQVATITTAETCQVTNPPGFIHLVIRSGTATRLDVQIVLPDTFTAIPSRVGDQQNWAILNESCTTP